MAENTWTASTTTSWIWFDSSKEEKSITGNGGETITIYVEEATEPTTDVNGKITITANGTSFDKTITRCAPSVTSTTNSLIFDVYYNGSEIGTKEVGPCESGKKYNDTSGVEIKNIKLKTTEYYSNGESKELPDQTLTLSDVNVWYILPDGSKYGSLPANNDKERTVNVKVELKSDTKINNTSSFTQKGIKGEDGKYIESNLHSTGYTTETIEYGALTILEKDKESQSCNAGEFVFNVGGEKTTLYGAKTGLTECDVKVTIDSGSRGSSTAYTTSDVNFSVTETQYANFDTDTPNKLVYAANETRTTDRVLHIAATLKDDATKTAETTFTVIAGNSCGEPMYIIFKCDKDYIDYTGGTATFKYYLSETEDGNEGSAIKDQNINKCLAFSAQNGVTKGEPTYSDGVFSVNVTFMQNTYKNGEEGYTWTFTASCESAEEDTKTISLYQANKREQIIPNCDYFIFKYIWGENDGRDLDSLTHMSNCTELSGKTVGYGGTAGNGDDESRRTKVVSGETGIYLKWGGDNQCNGSEYTIVCLKNILDAWKNNELSFVSPPNNDIMYIDIYAVWYGSKGVGQSMKIVYDQYSGKTSGGYNEEITETKNINTCLTINPTYYYSIEPTPGKCISVAEKVETKTISVNAAGMTNHSMAVNTNCIDGLYTHALRLNYNFASKTPSIEYFADNGFDTESDKTIVRINGVNNELSYKYTATTTGEAVQVEYKNVYLKHTVNGITHDVYLFDSDKDYIYCNEFTGGEKKSSNYRKSDVDAGTIVNLSYISNFKIVKNTDRTINISFNMSQASEKREFDLGIHALADYLGTCGNLVYMFGFIETYQEIS